MITALMAVVTIVMSFASAGASAAGNWTDTYETITYIADGGDVITQSREKWDYTPNYIYNLPDSYATILPDIVGTVSGTPRYYWDSGAQNCTYSGNNALAPGQKEYIHNLVKERGYNNCNFQLMPLSQTLCRIHIAWSPDSIGS